MPVAAIGGRHEAAMGAAEKLRGGPTWGPAGRRYCGRAGRVPGGRGQGAARFPGFQVFTGPGAAAGGKLKF